MAEARSAVADLREPLAPILVESKDSWKVILLTLRKTIVRRYYRTRNSIKNGVYPTSVNNLVIAFCIALALLIGQPDATSGLNYYLWSLKHYILLAEALPIWVQAMVIAVVVSIVFFMALMTVRQFLLRILLAYKGWMYEPLHHMSKGTLFWGLIVKLVSGYQPSLYSCQRSLPRLPVPKLSDTIERLLQSLEPLSSKEEMDKLRTQAEEFKTKIGPKLQRILILKSWWANNYVTDWWEKYVYLMSRIPIAINSNYYCLDHSYWKPTSLPASRAATLTHFLLKMKRMIDREELEPITVRNIIPVCMLQFERLFSTVRIPGEDNDTLIHYDSKNSRHIIVICNGCLYRVDVYDDKGQILAPMVFEEQMSWIMKDSLRYKALISDEERFLPVLTAIERDKWACIRAEHFSEGINSSVIAEIEKAIFVLSFIDSSYKTFEERGKYLMYGDGSSHWFDKSLSVFLFNDGHTGMNVEHSLADAPAIGLAWEYTLTHEVLSKCYMDDGRCMPMPRTFKQGKWMPPRRVCWDMTERIKEKVQSALRFHLKNSEDLDLVVFDHDKWGKGVIKKCKVSPDAFIQMALQLAYYKDAKKLCLTYEASMTRLFQGGRTETVRSCTKEVREFVMAMQDEKVPKDTKISLLKAAAKQHQTLYRHAMCGKGVDRHLFAMLVLSKGLGYKSEFLESVMMQPWTLSTSQSPQQQQPNVPDCNLEAFRDKTSPGGGFGPVSDDGYGVAYMLPSDFNMYFHISSKHHSPHTDSKRYAKNICEALDEMKKLFMDD